jgi:ornithine cyclodeaminase
VITSPTGFLQFDFPPGDVHIKSCALADGEFYVIKIASGFYHNPNVGLSSSNGLMLLFSQKTGELRAILLDEGRLTDIRTALAGAICAKYLAPKQIECIGIIGTGIQAKQQLLHLQLTTSCREVIVWGRNPSKALAFIQDTELSSFNLKIVNRIEELTQHCRLIVTATPSDQPLLFGDQILPGTHVTAVGADSLGKQELDPTLFQKADFIVVDSLCQCLEYGDLSHAKNEMQGKPILELGTLIKAPVQRQEHWITIADLTGVAIEDLQVATAISQRLQNRFV